MLDKDHTCRIDLDGIVEDDWVTHEGSDPFFFDGEKHILCTSFNFNLVFSDSTTSADILFD